MTENVYALLNPPGKFAPNESDETLNSAHAWHGEFPSRVYPLLKSPTAAAKHFLHMQENLRRKVGRKVCLQRVPGRLNLTKGRFGGFDPLTENEQKQFDDWIAEHGDQK